MIVKLHADQALLLTNFIITPMPETRSESHLSAKPRNLPIAGFLWGLFWAPFFAVRVVTKAMD